MESKISDLIRKGKKIYKQGQYDIALEIFNDILNIYPDNINALEKIGNVYFALDNLNEALNVYNNLRSICNRYSFKEKEKLALETLGRIYTLLEKYFIAINMYLEALTIYDKLETSGGRVEEEKFLLLHKIRDLYYKQKNFSQALLTCKKLLALHSQFGPLEAIADDLSEIGNLLYKQNKYTEALKQLKEALQIYNKQKLLSKIVITQFEIGKIYYKLNRYSKALYYLQDTLNNYEKLGMEKHDDYYYGKVNKLIGDIKNSLPEQNNIQ